MYSSSIQNLINELKKLPSIGQRSAERFVFHWLKKGKGDVGELKLALDELLENVKSCKTCWDFTDDEYCQICNDKKRDHSTICVVSSSQDLQTIEGIKEYSGVYHVLRGLISDIEYANSPNVKIKELIERVKKEDIKEIILALNPNLAGETTTLLIQKNIKDLSPDIKMTKLARGLPMGSDLQYADEITLGSALKNRI